MALNYLLDPCLQHQNRAGVNNVHGFFKVFLSGTDDTGDIAETYSNFSGALNPERIEIDNNGRCVIIADDSHPYRVEMYLPNGDLVYTQEPVWPIANGGGGASITDIESSDGSISVDKTTVGGKTTFDIGINREDDPQFLDWIKCSGSSASSGNLVPNKADGTMSVGSLGVELSADMLYHVSGVVRGTMYGVGADYDAFVVRLYLNDGETSTEVQWFTFIADRSLGLAQDFNFDADIKVGSADAELVISITGAETGMSFSLPSLDIHRVYSGIPKLPDGVATQEWVDDHYQKKLTAGTGITIDPVTNTISADAAQQVQSDWNEADTSSPAYIKNKPDMDSYATYQELTSGLATKQDVIQDIADIRAGAQQGATAVQPSDLFSALDPYATKQEVTQDLSTKQNTIEDLTQIRQGASLGATALQPGALDPYATKQEVTAGLAGKQDTISDLATIRSGAAAGATAVQPGDLAAVATSGSYNDLSDKPSIPAPVTVDQHYNASSANAQSGTAVAEALDAYQALPASTTQDAGKVLKVDSNGDPEWAAGGGQQVQSDWAQTDSSAVDFIKNKPNLAAVATSGSYNDLSDKPSIPAAQVQSDWDQSNNQAVDFIKNKPSLATVATSGSYDDLSNKPSIPDPQVQADWSESDNTKADFIKNKPNLATVATSGSYNDLSDKPTIPVQQQADWNQSDSAAVDYIKNKPDLSGFATKTEVTQGLAGKQDVISDLATIRSGAAEGATAVQPGDLAAVATSGSYNDLSDKPSIPAAQVNADWNASSGVAEILNKPQNLVQDASYVHTDNNFTTTEKDKLAGIQAGAEQNVQSDWNQSNSSADDYIKNKPTIPVVPAMKSLVAGSNVTITEDANAVTISADGGPVDQVYDATSSNAQSGTAVAGAISGKEDAFGAGKGLEFTTDGQGNRVLQVEGPVDIVAGPGIVIDNPDGNTLRISQAHPTDETVLWTVPSGSTNANGYSIVLSETIHNFEEIAVYCKCTRIANSLQVTTKNVYPVCDAGFTMFADGVSTNKWNADNTQNGHYTCGVDVRLTGATGYIGENYRWGVQNGTSTWEVQRVSNNSLYPHPYKIVGIKRVANN